MNKSFETFSGPQKVIVASPVFDTGESLSNDGPDFGASYYLRVLRIHKWTIVLVTLAGLMIGLLFSSAQVPKYQASTTLIVQPESSNPATIEGGIESDYAWRFYETQNDIIRSQVLAEKVVEKLGLVFREGFEKSPSIGAEKNFIHSFKDFLRPLKRSLEQLLGVLPIIGSSPDQTTSDLADSQEFARKYEALAAKIRANISVTGNSDTQVVTVFYTSIDPSFAAEAVNAVAQAYIELGLQSRMERSAQANNWLSQQINELRTKVAESENALQNFQLQQGMLDAGNRENVATRELAQLHNKVLALQESYAELEKRYGPKHPTIVRTESQLREARRKFQILSDSLVDSRRKGFELNKLEREVANNQQLLEMFVKRSKEADLATDQTFSNIRVLDRAKVPKYATSPFSNKILGIWTLVGLFLGLTIAFVREKLDNTFKTAKDIESLLDVSVLGAVPLLEGQPYPPEVHYLNKPKSPFAEAINNIRTSILYSNVDDPPSTILVMSSIQGEGKSTLCSNLALSYAQLGKTLLIDGDLRKPGVGEFTSQPARSRTKGPGLVEFVAGNASSQQCILKAKNHENLFMLKSGVIPPNPLELLSSNKLEKTIEKLKQRFDHIVIDTAPILPVSDAIILGHLVDKVIMVVQSERTTHAMARESLKRMRAAGISVLGVVLAQVSRHSATYYADPTSSQYYQDYYGAGSGKEKKTIS